MPHFREAAAADPPTHFVSAADAKELLLSEGLQLRRGLLGCGGRVRQRLFADQALQLRKLAWKATLVRLQRRFVAVETTNAVFLIDEGRRQDRRIAQFGEFLKVGFDADNLPAPPTCFQIRLNELV